MLASVRNASAIGLLALLMASPAAGQPVEGNFVGNTSQSWHYNLRVATGGTSLSFLYLEGRVADCYFYYWTTASIPVTGGQFSETYADSCFPVTTSGTFTSPSSAAGTFSLAIPAGCQCAGSATGTWVAYGPPASLCPAGSAARNLFYDGFENPYSGWWTNPVLTGVNHWNGCAGSPDIYCTTSPWSGAYHLRGRDTSSKGDSAAAMAPAARTTLPAGARMQFDHSFSFVYGYFENNVTPFYFDGAVLEYSINSGST